MIFSSLDILMAEFSSSVWHIATISLSYMIPLIDRLSYVKLPYDPAHGHCKDTLDNFRIYPHYCSKSLKNILTFSFLYSKLS